MHTKNPIILDCTLRDGSYVIDFQFNKNHTKKISSALANAKIKYIEIGHGIGLGASKAGYGKSAITDEEYCVSMSNAKIGESKWGMFCIPGIASIDDLLMTIDHGIDFIRIGTDIDKIEESKTFIEIAKKRGLTVFSNFMKSYKVSSKTFSSSANLSHQYGSDIIYIVDSAGTMTPNKVKEFADNVMQSNENIKLGFHGHNNLGLGMGNCIAAIESGVKFVDSTLQGMGRSAGNVATEHLVCVLNNMNLCNDIDPIQIMDIGEKLIRPLLYNVGYSSLDITSGWKEFHSSHMKKILEVSKKNNLDPRRLISNLFDNKIGINETEKIKYLIKNMKSKYPTSIKKWPKYFGEEES
mgnify:FL=1|tara:strand:- start:7619 stop:8677 length:1059 start_codon:yes stop_codon:yes gene_type:complete